MNAILETDYQIVIIIITIIGFIISTAFYVYFVYLPASRIEDQFDIISKQGEEVITTINDRIIDVENSTTETLTSICQSIRSLICTYNCLPVGGGCQNPTSFCPLRSDAYPDYCNSLVPFTSCPSSTCTSGNCNVCTPTNCPPIEIIPPSNRSSSSFLAQLKGTVNSGIRSTARRTKLHASRTASGKY